MTARALPPEWAAMAVATGKPFAEGGAYSSDCFVDWLGCVHLLRERGATLAGAEVLLRSKHMRWCAEGFPGSYGETTTEHFARYLDEAASARAMAEIVDPTPTPLDLTAPIRSLRAASGLTYAAAAARLAPPGHPHPSTGLVTRPESYGAGARVCTVVRFARAWGCPVEVRLGGRVLAWPEEGLDVSVRDLCAVAGLRGEAVTIWVVGARKG